MFISAKTGSDRGSLYTGAPGSEPILVRMATFNGENGRSGEDW